MPAGFSFPIGFALGLVLVTMLPAVGLSSAQVLIVLVLVVGRLSAVTTFPASLAIATACWACFASFVIGHAGDLVLGTTSEEAAAVLLGCAAGVTGVATILRRVRRRQQTPLDVPDQARVRFRPGWQRSPHQTSKRPR